VALDGYRVVDADGHGGEPQAWHERVPRAHRENLTAYLRRVEAHYRGLPASHRSAAGAGHTSADARGPGYGHAMRPGMWDPSERLPDMDAEGIDVAVLFPPGAGEEWAMLDPVFAAALCRALNDARADYCAFAPDRLRAVAKLPLIDPVAAADELERCVADLGMVGAVVPQHVRERNLDDAVFDGVWGTAACLGVPVLVHGGGQAPDQVPVVIDRFATRLAQHALSHPVGHMMAVTCFTVGGILARHPSLRVGFMEGGIGWLPFWLERLDEHYALLPDQAPEIDRPPSEYFLSGRCFISGDSDERGVAIVEHAFPGLVCYASDYFHWDCKFPDSARTVLDREDLGEASRGRVLAGNAERLYALQAP
jgi:predicted TIM-barrel fold metal-dependent hydrolase